MNPEKTHLYKKQYQQPIEEETPPKKGKSKTAATSDSRKRSKHKHIYKKIILQKYYDEIRSEIREGKVQAS